MINEAISVAQLNRYVKSLLAQDSILSHVTVRGEISNFTRHYKSGHLYFTLKDEDSAVKAVMFRSSAQALRFAPENGMSVIVSGSVTIYERDGSYQLYVQSLQPDGIGALSLAFEQLKSKLQQEGLFARERKRILPQYPETIGIITSEGAAALQDMLNILKRRYPCARILLCPALVQGELAPQSLTCGLETLNEIGCDVIIIGRGGGSMEDLWAFNDETLARAIVASAVPVVSAVGHETDFTIADFAADLRAPTPSAAAELVTPDREDVLYYLGQMLYRCGKAAENNVQKSQMRLRLAESRLRTPEGILNTQSDRLEWASHTICEQIRFRLDSAHDTLSFVASSLEKAMENRMERTTFRLKSAAKLVEMASPIRLLEQGFSRTSTDGVAVTSLAMVDKGAILTTRVTDGEIFSEVTHVIHST